MANRCQTGNKWLHYYRRHDLLADAPIDNWTAVCGWWHTVGFGPNVPLVDIGPISPWRSLITLTFPWKQWLIIGWRRRVLTVQRSAHWPPAEWRQPPELRNPFVAKLGNRSKDGKPSAAELFSQSREIHCSSGGVFVFQSKCLRHFSNFAGKQATREDWHIAGWQATQTGGAPSPGRQKRQAQQKRAEKSFTEEPLGGRLVPQ